MTTFDAAGGAFGSQPVAGVDLSAWTLRARTLEAGVRVGNELRWPLELEDGRRAVLGQLVAELADDSSVRRRYLRDVERWFELSQRVDHAVVPMLAHGPTGADGGAPWRLRLDPEGERLDRFLERRAPLPAGEASALLANLCDALSAVHKLGFVLRDMSPARVILTAQGPRFVDVGLARVDILSTRTAASLVLEASPYGAPELLARTAVDARADLYAVGVLAFVLLTGTLPFGDTHALLRPSGEAPRPSTALEGQPGQASVAALDDLVVRLLAVDPRDRPASATAVAAVLRGEASLEEGAGPPHPCQSCGRAMPLGQRLCLGCGRVGVQFTSVAADVEHDQRYKVVLRAAQEDTEWVAKFADFVDTLSDGERERLEFLVGDARMYSKKERELRARLPATLFCDLDQATADRIVARLKANGMKAKVQRHDDFDAERGRWQLKHGQKVGMGVFAGFSGVLAVGLGVGAAPVAGVAVAAVMGGLGVAMLFGIKKQNESQRAKWGTSLLQLRPAPAALPASDPLVAKVAGLLERASVADVRDLVADVALVVQRLADHRAANLDEAAEIDMALEPVTRLVDTMVQRVEGLARIDAELAELDEGVLVRELAASRARKEPEAAQLRLLERLDRLRDLEEARAELFAGLLEARDLMRRAAELGLEVRDTQQEHERHVAAALRSLEAGELSRPPTS